MLPWIDRLINFLRIALPVISLFGSAPTFFIFWFLLRLITSICFSPHIYRRCDDYLYSLYQQFILFFFENWVNVKIYFHGDYKEIIKRKENVLYMSNHQSSVDWIVADMLAVRQGSLGHLRYVLKSDLRWIPLYGFYFQQHGCIYVYRKGQGDLERMEKGISQIKSNGLPVWLVIFPEGTRYNPVKNPNAIERSRQFAKEKGLPSFDNVLCPRTGGTIAAINALKDKLDAIYDITIAYTRTDNNNQQQIRLAAPTMTEYLQGQAKELHIHVESIPIDSIPTNTNEQISDWIYNRFVIKDKLLKDFYNSNLNEKGLQVEPSSNITIYSCISFILTTFLLLTTELGRTIYWQICLFGTPICFLWMHLYNLKNQI